MFRTRRWRTAFFRVHSQRRRMRLSRADGDSASECLHFLKSLTYVNTFFTWACAHKAARAETGIYECVFKILTWVFEKDQQVNLYLKKNNLISKQ